MQPRPQYMLPGYVGAGKLRGKVALITGGDSGPWEPASCVARASSSPPRTADAQGVGVVRGWGGGAGIGRAVAVLFAREGARIAIGYLPQEQADAEETKAAVEHEDSECLLLPGDIRSPETCRDLVSRTAQQYGPIDILVNNAGTQLAHDSLEDLTDEDIESTFKVRWRTM